jgi:sulfur-carrier protein
VVVRFFASMRNITGVKETEWSEPAPTLGALLRLLSDRYGPEFRRWVFDGEELGGSILVVVNGNDARHQAGLATPLAATDVVSILPIMAGGGHFERSAVSGQLSAFGKSTTRNRALDDRMVAVSGCSCVVVSG